MLLPMVTEGQRGYTAWALRREFGCAPEQLESLARWGLLSGPGATGRYSPEDRERLRRIETARVEERWRPRQVVLLARDPGLFPAPAEPLRRAFVEVAGSETIAHPLRTHGTIDAAIARWAESVGAPFPTPPAPRPGRPRRGEIRPHRERPPWHRLSPEQRAGILGNSRTADESFRDVARKQYLLDDVLAEEHPNYDALDTVDRMVLLMVRTLAAAAQMVERHHEIERQAADTWARNTAMTARLALTSLETLPDTLPTIEETT